MAMIDKKLFAKNSVSGFVQKIIIAIVTFIAIPIFIHVKGAQVYGIFAAVAVLGELGRLTEMGFNKTLIKFLSSQGKTKESSQDIVVAFAVVFTLLVGMTTTLLFLSDFVLIKVLNIPHNDLYQSRQLFTFAIIANGLLLLGNLFSSVIESQRFIYKINILQLVYSMLYWGLIILVLVFGFDLKEIGLVIFIAALVWFMLITRMMLKIWGKFEMKGFFSYFKVSLKKQTSYSVKVYLSSLLSMFEEPLIKVLIANFFGLSFVGFFDIAVRIKSQVYRLLQTLVYPVFQLFSEMKDPKQVNVFMKEIEEKLFLALGPLSVIVACCTGSFIDIWLGDGQSTVIMSVIVITVGALFLQLTILPTVYYLTIYHPTVLVLTQIAGIVFNIGIIYFLRNLIGYNAIYISFAVYYVTNLVLRLYYQKKYLGTKLFTEKTFLYNFLLGLFLLIVAGGSLSILFSSSPLLNLIITPILLLLLTFLIFKNMRLLVSEDFEKYPIMKFAQKWFLSKTKTKINFKTITSYEP